MITFPRRSLLRFAALTLLPTAWLPVSALAEAYTAEPTHAIAMHGEPAYPEGFSHFAYANPDAPKGGTITLETSGGFDNFNPFILRGQAAPGISVIYDTLLTRGDDQAFTEYARLASSIELPEDRSWVAFNLNPDARWHDGKPVTADDVVWSFNTLVEKGQPFFANYYGDVSEARATAPDRVLFVFGDSNNRELPLILGQMVIMPKHFWEGRDFQDPLTEPPLGSGPYKVESFEFGRNITYSRVEDYWALIST